MSENKNVGVGIGAAVAAMFLVAGTCIGGGMLALPVATGVMGFAPSLVVMFVCWLMMTFTGLLFLEISLWMSEGAHVISMSSEFLGKFGKGIAWILYLFICYASMVAYTAGGGSQVAQLFRDVAHWPINYQMACLLFVVLFVGIVYLGGRVVGRVNSILFISMIISYVALVGIGIPQLDVELLAHRQWSGWWMAVPLLLTAFSFQTMVPSLTPLLKRDAKKLRLAVAGGATLAFVIYVAWQALVLGMVPVAGLKMADALGVPATEFLQASFDSVWISSIVAYFSFFALVTSFLGITFGLFDFLSDGLKIKEEGWGKLFLALLIVVPVFFFATMIERVFLLALDATGGIGDAILNGMMPVMMVWVGRYYRMMPNSYRVWGGKPILAIVFVLYFIAFAIEIISHTNLVTPMYDEPGTLDF